MNHIIHKAWEVVTMNPLIFFVVRPLDLLAV